MKKHYLDLKNGDTLRFLPRGPKFFVERQCPDYTVFRREDETLSVRVAQNRKLHWKVTIYNFGNRGFGKRNHFLIVLPDWARYEKIN